MRKFAVICEASHPMTKWTWPQYHEWLHPGIS